MGVEPENTLRSFRRAQADGVDEIELDIHLTRDNQLVIMHDLDVSRTTNGTGLIAEHTLAELRELDAGFGERVPTFSEALDAITVPIHAEVKAVDAARATVDLLVERNLLHRTTVTSFFPEAIAAAKERRPDLVTGFIVNGAPPDCVRQALDLGAGMLCAGIARLTEKLVAEAHHAGLSVVGWPVNSPEELLAAYRLGVDAVTTDFPSLPQDTIRAIPDLIERMERLRKSFDPAQP